MNLRTSRKKSRKQKATDLIIQGSILAMASIAVCIISMLYRMFLNDIIGKQGNGYYISAFNMYSILLILSSYSMPVAVSKTISTRLARGEYRNYSRILKAALTYATVVGGIAAVVLRFGMDLFAKLTKTPFNRYALETLVPTTWIMAYLDVLRGYFQGTGTMVPTAVSQILEQAVNATISAVAAEVLFGVGTSINAAQGAGDYSYALSAAGGTIDTGIGTPTAFLLLIYPTASKGRERRQLVREGVSGRMESYHGMFYIFTIATLPIVISNGIYNCSSVVDNYLFGQDMNKLGYLEDSIATYQGVLGQYRLLFNIPVAISDTPSSSLIPPLARAIANKNRREKLERIAISIRSPLLIAISTAMGVMVLAKPVCNLLFISEDSIMLIQLSMMGSLAVMLYSLLTATNTILQGLDHVSVPIHHTVTILVAHMAALEASLIISKIEIYSMTFANIILALVMCLLNGYAIARLARYRQEHKRTLILPTICTGFVGAAAYRVYKGIYALFPHQLMRGRISMAIAMFPFMAVAVLVYAVLLARFRTVEKEKLKGMPGGKGLIRLLNRFRFLG